MLRKYHTQRETSVHLLPPETWAKISETYGFDDFVVERLEAKETEEQIRRVAERLPAKCREIFIMSRFENMSNEEIASAMNLSEHTVKTQLYRALQKIREAMDEGRR
jgi:RNA polymerase sigma-70 factor (ECF subfamily)